MQILINNLLKYLALLWWSMSPLSLAFKLLFPGVYLKRPVGYKLSFLKDKCNVLILSLKHLNVYPNPDQLQKTPWLQRKEQPKPIYLWHYFKMFSSLTQRFLLPQWLGMHVVPKHKAELSNKTTFKKTFSFPHSASP